VLAQEQVVVPGRLEQVAPVEAVVLELAVRVAGTAEPVDRAGQGMPPDC